MTKRKSTTPPTTNKIKAVLFLAGLALTFGWALIVAAANLSTTLACTVSPTDCSKGQEVANVLVFLPILAGCVLVPAGINYGSKFSRLAQFTITLILGLLLFFGAFYTIAFVGIGIHGIEP